MFCTLQISSATWAIIKIALLLLTSAQDSVMMLDQFCLPGNFMQAATEPLIALAKSIGSTAVAYLGSGSAVAINSGMGVLRLGMGKSPEVFVHPFAARLRASYPSTFRAPQMHKHRSWPGAASSPFASEAYTSARCILNVKIPG